MARSARHKSPDAAFYHLLNRVTGDPSFFPFQNRRVARRFLSLLEFYLQLYYCRMAAFQLMGNHYHLVLFFQQFRCLDPDELRQRARLRFGPRWQLKTQHWLPSHWQQFNRDLFDVSRFMQHLNGEFSKWFNHRYHRRGHFWADRFKNPQLLDTHALQACILYCELNCVRAGLVKRPELHKYSSAYWRWAGKKTQLLIPLEELFSTETGQDAFTSYRSLLYYSGSITSRPSQSVIPNSIVRQQQLQGFPPPGMFRRRLRFFSDGVAIGNYHNVQLLLHTYRKLGLYKRRKYPIPHLLFLFFSLREQRSHAFSTGQLSPQH